MSEENRSIRVAVVAPHLLESGGIPGVARFLVGALDRTEDFEPRVFSVATSARDSASVRLLNPRSWLSGAGAKAAMWNGRSCAHVGGWFVELEFMRYLPREALTRRLETCDVVQVIAGTPAHALLGARCDAPVALQVATLISEERKRTEREMNWSLRSVWRRLMTGVTSRFDRLGARLADAVFVENRWMEKRMKELSDGRITYAPPGVNADRFRPTESARDEPDPGYLLSVARFDDSRKRVTVLFDAYARVVRRLEDPPDLVLAGASGPPAEAWKRADALGIRDHVHFHENLPTDELASLYRRASLFVLASAEEGLGLVFLEAQASGVPVVATRTHGSESAVDEGVTGLLSPVDDPDALAACVTELLSDDERRSRMRRAARQRAEEVFSRDVAAKRFLREYRRLASVSS